VVSFVVGFCVQSLLVTFGILGAATGVVAVVGVQQPSRMKRLTCGR